MNKKASPARRALLGTALAAAPALAQAVQINGAGATFPYPIYSKWFSDYTKTTQGIKINYQSIGSGGGIRQLTEQTVDFGATDGPMTEEEMATPRRQGPPLPHGPRRRRRDLQPAEVKESCRFTGGWSRTSSSARSPSGTTRASPRRTRVSRCRPRTSSSCIAPTAAAPATSSPTTSPR